MKSVSPAIVRIIVRTSSSRQLSEAICGVTLSMTRRASAAACAAPAVSFMRPTREAMSCTSSCGRLTKRGRREGEELPNAARSTAIRRGTAMRAPDAIRFLRASDDS
jgi:hypothetical protein